MSLHAQLSPEAAARLEAQKRNSFVTSIIIALLVVALVILILLLILMEQFRVESPTIVTYSAGGPDEEQLDENRVNQQIKPNPSAPSSSMAKVIASTNPSPTAIPIPEMQVPEPSLDFGSGDDFGAGWGSGGDGGGGFGNIPQVMRKRCSKSDRLQRLAANGGNAKCEEAVVKALDWFKKTQAKDGSWPEGGHVVGQTGVVLLAYLGHCETPLSKEYGETVEKAIVYLVNVSTKNKGNMGTDFNSNAFAYEHAIATYALAEAYTFCVQIGVNIPGLQKAVLNGGQVIIDGQNKSGGWTYKFADDARNDTSVNGWCMQALKACDHTKLKFRGLPACVKRGLGAIAANHDPSSGGIGYTGPGNKPATTAIGALCYQMFGKTKDQLARKACALLDQTLVCKWEDGASDLYAHYYASQAMINHGGKYWKNYNKKFRDEVLKNQNQDGTWKQPANASHGGNSVVLRTAFCTLMLEVYYRFLPGTGQKSS